MVSRRDFLRSVRERIASGEWPPGTKLPTTAILAEDYGISESMVNQAMAALIETREVETIPGGARYVAGGTRGETTGEIKAP